MSDQDNLKLDNGEIEGGEEVQDDSLVQDSEQTQDFESQQRQSQDSEQTQDSESQQRQSQDSEQPQDSESQQRPSQDSEQPQDAESQRKSQDSEQPQDVEQNPETEQSQGNDPTPAGIEEVQTSEPSPPETDQPLDGQSSERTSFDDEEGLHKQSEKVVKRALSEVKRNPDIVGEEPQSDEPPSGESQSIEPSGESQSVEPSGESQSVEPVAEKPILKHYFLSENDTEGSLLYEKDGNWVLAKTPPYTFRPKKGREKNNNETPRTKCCLEKDTEPPTFTQNMQAMYDVLIGKDSYPCNECDKPVCHETLWQWLSSVVVDIAEAVKEMNKQRETSTSACGSMDAETLKMNTKGTHVDLEELRANGPQTDSTAPDAGPELDVAIIETEQAAEGDGDPTEVTEVVESDPAATAEVAETDTAATAEVDESDPAATAEVAETDPAETTEVAETDPTAITEVAEPEPSTDENTDTINGVETAGGSQDTDIDKAVTDDKGELLIELVEENQPEKVDYDHLVEMDWNIDRIRREFEQSIRNNQSSEDNLLISDDSSGQDVSTSIPCGRSQNHDLLLQPTQRTRNVTAKTNPAEKAKACTSSPSNSSPNPTSSQAQRKFRDMPLSKSYRSSGSIPASVNVPPAAASMGHQHHLNSGVAGRINGHLGAEPGFGSGIRSYPMNPFTVSIPQPYTTALRVPAAVPVVTGELNYVNREPRRRDGNVESQRESPAVSSTVSSSDYDADDEGSERRMNEAVAALPQNLSKQRSRHTTKMARGYRGRFHRRRRYDSSEN